MWKAGLLEKILGKPIKVRQFNSKAKGVSYPSYGIYVGNKYFRILRRYLYRNNKKNITQATISRLTPMGLAIWYLDDGCLYTDKSGALTLSLALGLPKQEAEVVAKALNKKFGVTLRIYPMKGNVYYGLSCRTAEAIKFVEVVKKPILEHIKCLTYKVKFDKREAILATKPWRRIAKVEDIVYSDENTSKEAV